MKDFTGTEKTDDESKLWQNYTVITQNRDKKVHTYCVNSDN